MGLRHSVGALECSFEGRVIARREGFIKLLTGLLGNEDLAAIVASFEEEWSWRFANEETQNTRLFHVDEVSNCAMWVQFRSEDASFTLDIKTVALRSSEGVAKLISGTLQGHRLNDASEMSALYDSVHGTALVALGDLLVSFYKARVNCETRSLVAVLTVPDSEAPFAGRWIFEDLENGSVCASHLDATAPLTCEFVRRDASGPLLVTCGATSDRLAPRFYYAIGSRDFGAYVTRLRVAESDDCPCKSFGTWENLKPIRGLVARRDRLYVVHGCHAELACFSTVTLRLIFSMKACAGSAHVSLCCAEGTSQLFLLRACRTESTLLRLGDDSLFDGCCSLFDSQNDK